MVLAIFPMLMYINSLTLYKTMVMAIHNQYPDIELVSPIHSCNHGIHRGYSVERTNTGAAMKIDFKLDHDQDVFEGISVYEIQRNTRSGYQSSIDTTPTEAAENPLRIMRLLVIWKIERSKRPKVNVVLVEYDNGLVLDEDKLAQLYYKVNDIAFGYDPSESRWLMYDDDDAALTAGREVIRKTGLELKITIYQGVRNTDTIRPMWIESGR
jgi:hypothetical protein